MAKFDAMMLELAIKQHQPEGHIAVDLASSIRQLDDLSKKLPQHQEIAKWKARAHEVDSKIVTPHGETRVRHRYQYFVSAAHRVPANFVCNNRYAISEYLPVSSSLHP